MEIKYYDARGLSSNHAQNHFEYQWRAKKAGFLQKENSQQKISFISGMTFYKKKKKLRL